MGAGNVIGIDFGSDTMKVAIVQPGAPMEIVTNLQSKRKTPTAISFYRGERLFGADATAIIARKPDLTFVKLNRILGKTVDHSVIKQMKVYNMQLVYVITSADLINPSSLIAFDFRCIFLRINFIPTRFIAMRQLDAQSTNRKTRFTVLKN